MYEYKVISLGAKADREEDLNELGKRGWYLVNVSDDTFGHVTAYFVREAH